MAYPKATYFILGQELSERFAYYGLMSLLPCYFTSVLALSEESSTQLIHGFKALVMLCPVLGAVLADSLMGKYSVILLGSLVYSAGLVVVSATSLPPHWMWGAILGLLMVSVGTGGIKACVAAFLGDQFPAEDPRMEAAFMLFYWCINLGSTLTYIVTPLLRAHIPAPYNYAAGFALPALLLLAATVVIASGRKHYTHVAPKGSAITNVFKQLWHAVRRRSLQALVPDICSAESVAELRQLLRVMLVFLPLPIFWSLFEQNGSRFVLQATHMDNSSPFQVEPDQMPIFNALSVMLLIPVFNKLVYPFLRKRGFAMRPLVGKMVPGMILISFSFVIAALLDYIIFANELNSIAWPAQIPQYLFLTAGEVMVSPVSLEFAYSEAPPQLKSFIMALNYLTIAMGNVLVVVLSAIPLDITPPSQPLNRNVTSSGCGGNELIVEQQPVFAQYARLLFFAGLMAVFAFVFWLLARRYTYKEDDSSVFHPLDETSETEDEL